MTELRNQTVIRFEEDEHCERILWTVRGKGFFSIDIQDTSASPHFWTLDQLEEMLQDAQITIIEDPWLRPFLEDALPRGQKDRRDAAWALIQPLLAEQPRIFHPTPRFQLIEKIVTDTGVARNTIYRHLRRYWQRGMTPNALLPDYRYSGGRGEVRQPNKAKRGHPRKYGASGMNVEETDRANIHKIVVLFFAKNNQLDISSCYRRLLQDYYSESVIDPSTKQQQFVIRPKHPTLRQFRYWLERDNDLYLLERKRRTPRVYDKDFRTLLGNSTQEVLGPGSRYQIDATIADVYLLSRLDRRKIVGRPVLYFVIDVFSHMIVGLYVGFEGPSWVGAMMAIANATTSKVEFCQQLGIEITEADWPCRYMPEAILGDRGEMLGSGGETLIKNFNVRLENTPPYRADWKGIVERQFGLVHAAFRPYTPGYVAPDFMERGAPDYRLEAKLNIDEFTKIIINYVLCYNNHREIQSYKMDSQMREDDVRPIPVELWEWGLSARSGSQRTFSPDHIRLSLMPAGEAAVTARGVRFYGVYYSCAKAIEEHWFERARRKGQWKVTVSYDPRNMDTIFLHHVDGENGFVTCGLTAASETWRDKTLWEIDHIRQEDRAARAGHQPQRMAADVDLDRKVQAIVESAEEANRKLPQATDSKAKQVGGIRGNRAEERHATGKGAAFSKETAKEHVTPAKVLPFPSGGKDEEKDGMPSVAEFGSEFGEEEEKDVDPE